MVSYTENPHDRIRVFVEFNPAVAGRTSAHSLVRPVSFLWAGRRYDVNSVNLVYHRRVGKHNVWCFAVSDESNTFVLTYDPESLEWMLDEVQGM